MPSLLAMAALRRSTAAAMPRMRYGECRCSSDGERNAVALASVMPRRANTRATIGETLASAQSASTWSASGFRNDHRTGALLFVLIGIINQDAVIIIGCAL